MIPKTEKAKTRCGCRAAPYLIPLFIIAGCKGSTPSNPPTAPPAAVHSTRIALARKALDSAIQRKPDDPYLALERILLDRASGTQTSPGAMADIVRRFPKFARGFFYLGLDLLNSGQDLEALAQLEKAAALDPSDAETQTLAGICAFRTKRSAPAQEHLKAAIRLDPDRLELYLMLAQVYDNRATYPIAQKYLEEFISRAPNPSRGHYMLAKIYAAQTLRSRAEQEVAEAIKEDPKQSDYWILTGRIQAAFGGEERIRRAIQSYETAIRIDPNHWESHFELGSVLLQQSRATEALPHLEAALKLSPRPGPLHFYFAQALMRTGHKAEADQELAKYKIYKSYIDGFKTASREIERKPGNTGLRMKLADFCIQYSQLDAAALVLQEGAEQIPASAGEFYRRLASVYHIMGREAMAVRASDRAEAARRGGAEGVR